MSDTPKTDALEFNYATSGGGWGKPFDFARELEREYEIASSQYQTERTDKSMGERI